MYIPLENMKKKLKLKIRLKTNDIMLCHFLSKQAIYDSFKGFLEKLEDDAFNYFLGYNFNIFMDLSFKK